MVRVSHFSALWGDACDGFHHTLSPLVQWSMFCSLTICLQNSIRNTVLHTSALQGAKLFRAVLIFGHFQLVSHPQLSVGRVWPCETTQCPFDHRTDSFQMDRISHFGFACSAKCRQRSVTSKLLTSGRYVQEEASIKTKSNCTATPQLHGCPP